MEADFLKLFADSAWLWTALGAIAGFISRSLWDRFWRRRDELATLKRNKRIEWLERQLSEFYWPLYIRLQKDNVVWRKILDRKNLDDQLRSRVGFEIEKAFLLPNHDEIVKTIESKFHLGGADKDLSNQLFIYIRHIAVYKALRSSGVLDVDPIYLGEPWPAELFSLVEKKVNELQDEYNELLDLPSRA